MANIYVNTTNITGKIKPMHAVNNGPVHPDIEATRSSFDDFKAAKIPYVRTHDSSIYEEYGGEHVVDVHAIFPDFSKNPYNPDSYDFTLTDDYLHTIVEAGSSVFYRLGSKIEPWRKKYGTIVPSDFHKWAVICEHIIRHYNEGWANGYFYNIIYWEIWNEPDGVKEDGTKPNWSGTPEDFYEFYSIAAAYLKGRFPNLKIGGPAVCGFAENGKWTKDFLRYLTADGKRIPLDFFSWHSYTNNPQCIREFQSFVRKNLDDAGYTETESILNEYNYLENFQDKFVSSIENIIGMHGAALTSACMAVGQNISLDLLMYYDTSPSVFNGLFDFYTMRPLKGYYPFVMFSYLYELQNAVECCSDDEDIYAVAAENNGNSALMITHYRADKLKNEKTVTITLKGIKDSVYQAVILNRESTMERMPVYVENGTFSLKLWDDSVVLVKFD